ncbi:hypothetical protein [Dubosiella newyorkensis]|nr:hypothetical protein [Dubosiella newyorkensis]
MAPIIEVIGVVVTLLTLVINIINIPYMIVFSLRILFLGSSWASAIF